MMYEGWMDALAGHTVPANVYRRQLLLFNLAAMFDICSLHNSVQSSVTQLTPRYTDLTVHVSIATHP